MVMDKFSYLLNEAEAWGADSVEPTKKNQKPPPASAASAALTM